MWSSPSSRLRWKVSVGPAEVVGAKTTVEVSTVAEMLVSKVALLGFLIVVSVGGTTASTREPARAVANERHSGLIALLNVVFFTNHELAQHDLFRFWEETNTCKAVDFLSPNKLVEKVALFNARRRAHGP